MQSNSQLGAGILFLRALLVSSLLPVLSAQDVGRAPDQASPYVKRFEIHGVPILATGAVANEDLYVTALVYEHMTSRADAFDMRALHRASGFRILLIDPSESFFDLPEYVGQDGELDQADGLGGSIGEFNIALRVGSPHTLIHELAHGIYHSAIQFQETGGATDEEAWYEERVRAVHDMGFEEANEAFGEELIHEVLLAPAGTFSERLAKAWRHASELGLWRDAYAGTEPNEYWAEGVALWFGSGEPPIREPRSYLQTQDPMLFALCESVFPVTAWSSASVLISETARSRWSDEERNRVNPDPTRSENDLVRFLDRNGDGEVETYEGAEAFLLLSAEADRDQNGALNESELGSFFDRARSEELDERVGFFEELDANGDAQLSPSEVPDDIAPMLFPADTNGDGSISLQEVLEADELGDPTAMFEQELLEFFAHADHDGDGAFALTDLPSEDREEFKERFEALDTDGDLRLTMDELFALLVDEIRGATFDVQGDHAIMTGVIGPSTPGRVLQLILESPQVKTIIMQDVPGSMDDHSNLRAAKLVRRMGLGIHVPADGEIASGGTDFFLAGVRRSWEMGARFGVHSWGGFGEDGDQVPADDPEHRKYLDYYAEMGIPAEFYWYTLKAAPASDIHWMTKAELERYNFPAGKHASEHHQEADSNASHLGGAILREARAEAPKVLRNVSAISRTAEFAPLSKHLNAFGITLAAEQSVSDEFLTLVGQIIKEIFPTLDGIDKEAQSAVLTHLYRYRALLPVPKTEGSLERVMEQDPEGFDRIQQENSLCDIIMAEVPRGQVMEVVEHLLHAITDVGLHYQFPGEWGISRDSDLWRAMQKAIAEGHYVIDSYDDLREAGQEIQDRVLLQEFAYWFISTAWNLQEPYGPTEEEWQVKDRAELAELFPEFFAVYERTAMKVMRAPSLETLEELGPKRSAEGGDGSK